MKAFSNVQSLWLGYRSLQDASGLRDNRQRNAAILVCSVLVMSALLFLPARHLSARQGDASLAAAPAPTRRIAIVMHNSNDTDLFNNAEYGSNPNHRRYAEIHSYPFLLDSQPYVDWNQRSIPSGWIKSSGEHGYNKLIHLMDSVLRGIRTGDFDWVFWADGDTWLVNPSILLESYLPPERDWDADSTPYFIAAPDENGFNDGTMFLRANYWSYSFLAQSFADLYSPSGRSEGYSDQRSICRSLIHDEAAAKHFWRVPQPWFNQYPGVLSYLSKDVDIHNYTLQIHLVDKLKRDELIFQQNMDRVEAGWNRSTEEARELLPGSLTPNELIAQSVDLLSYNHLARAQALEFWGTAARPGIADIAWLDIE